MKVAIAVFRNVISPRLDTSDSLLIYDIENDVVKKKEKCSLTFDQPDQLTSILLKKEITAVICGACPRYFSRILLFHGIDVITGLTGEPENSIKMLISRQL